MTNGEKLQETFPNMRITVCESYVQVMGEKYEFNNTYPLDWWYTEYKEPSSSEIPISSEYVDRHSVDMLAYRYLKEPTDNHVAFYEDFLDLPSVTPAIPMIPKGRWITEISAHGWDGRSYQCSVCGRSIHLDTAVEDIYDYPYCHCGAKMGGSEEE